MISLIEKKRIDPVYVLNGTIVGLAGITPSSGYMDTWAVLPLAVVASVCSYFSMHFVKTKLRIDDALDVFSIHGVPSIIGAILGIGLFSSIEVNAEGVNGAVYGSWRQLGIQALGVVIVIAWTALISFPLVYILRRFPWFQLQQGEEHFGIDQHDHDQSAYRELEPISSTTTLHQRGRDEKETPLLYEMNEL